jgi:hypothetical protein
VATNLWPCQSGLEHLRPGKNENLHAKQLKQKELLIQAPSAARELRCHFFACVARERVPGLSGPGLQKIWLGLFIVEDDSSCETAVIKS